jgi:diguanylate cyclase (GGDEF)-like protein/PAS domain S-box-containing protein
MLAEAGHSVTEAADSDAAYEHLNTSPFEVVFCDWATSDENRHEFCRRVRDYGDGRYIYVILIIGGDQVEERWRGLEAGADDYLISPPDPRELRARLAVAARILQIQTTLTDTMSILESANRRFAELYLSLPIVCMTHDSMGGVHEYNRVCESVFNGLEIMQLQRKGWRALCAPSDAVIADAALARAFNGERTENMEWSHPMADGTARHFLCNILPLHGSDGTIVAAISAHVDITQHKLHEQDISQQLVDTNWSNALLEAQKKRTEIAYAELETANERLEALAFTDGLTGVMNHRAFQEQLIRECASASRHGTPLSLMLLDIDYFKGYNDSFGHQSGDRVLKKVASILEQSARACDAVARYGGEEFVVILPTTDEEGARVTAERFRAAIERASWIERQVTASFGVSTQNGGSADPQALIQAADLALYSSKNTGRNRVTHADDMTPATDASARAA